MNKQALSAQIGAKMNALGFSADFSGAGMEAWRKQSANGYITISAHDNDAKPLFPDNNLHAALEAKVWTVGRYDSDATFHDGTNNLTLEEAIAIGAAFENPRQKPLL
jgi:hypothetical protein